MGSWKCISLEKVSVNMFFWKILEVSIFGRLVCTYCLLKDDMPFVSGSYVTEVNDYRVSQKNVAATKKVHSFLNNTDISKIFYTVVVLL